MLFYVNACNLFATLKELSDPLPEPDNLNLRLSHVLSRFLNDFIIHDLNLCLSHVLSRILNDSCLILLLYFCVFLHSTSFCAEI